jgi:pimeloyl-ACP methyl ester carboxylesterase
VRSRLGLIAGLLVVAALTVVPVSTAEAAGVRVANACLSSVPEPGTKDKVKICYTLFRPAGASAKHPVPMLLHSHGWGGSRTTNPNGVREFLAAGYGVLSFDQRGWGASGGKAHVENPDLEGADVRRLVKLISKLSWVRQDGKGDPRLGSVGGSYGGGYQFLGAFESLRLRGKPVFDAMAPEITWNDLSQSIAPEGVVRTEWALALSAASLLSNALPNQVYEALVEGAVSGEWPDGSVAGTEDMVGFFKKNGPKWHINHGRRLDIPMLLGQGTTDTLFPLQQGLANWQKALTPRARKHSIFVAYNGGHVLPALLPRGVQVSSDPCSRKLAGGSFRQLSVRFFDETLKGRETGLGGWGRLHFATPASTCTSVDSFTPNRKYRLGRVKTSTAVGLPRVFEIAKGPLRIAGSSFLTGSVTARGVQNRAFYGLAVGTSRASARLIQNNVLPLSEPRAVRGKQRRIVLPSVAVDVPKGQHLYLLATPISDTFAVMGSRVPGIVTIDDTVVHLPVVRR